MTTTFKIKNHTDYFHHLLLEQYNKFMTPKNYNSSSHAIICSMLAYHLREWIWKCDSNSVKKHLLNLKIINQNQLYNDDFIECKFNEYVNKKCPEFRLIHQICNGSKHFKLKQSTINNTYKREGSFDGGFNGDSFLTNDLMVDDKNGNSIVFKKNLQIVVDFYGNLLKNL